VFEQTCIGQRRGNLIRIASASMENNNTSRAAYVGGH
jgi:hypothetical protein